MKNSILLWCRSTRYDFPWFFQIVVDLIFSTKPDFIYIYIMCTWMCNSSCYHEILFFFAIDNLFSNVLNRAVAWTEPYSDHVVSSHSAFYGFNMFCFIIVVFQKQKNVLKSVMAECSIRPWKGYSDYVYVHDCMNLCLTMQPDRKLVFISWFSICSSFSHLNLYIILKVYRWLINIHTHYTYVCV